MLKNLRKYLLSLLSIFMVVTAVLQWDIDELKASEVVYESLLPEVSGIPHAWTNEMIQLTIAQKDTDYMYSFSDKEGYYHWQKSNVSNAYGQNTTIYVAVMDQSGILSKETKIELTKLDLFQPKVSVTYEEKKGNVVFTVDATDDLSGVKEYSFDGGLNYQMSNTFTVKDKAEVSIHVKDYAGNVKVYEKTYSVDVSEETSIYSLTDKIDEDGNRYHEVTVENASTQYEYNLDETKWSNDTTKLIPYEKEDELVLKRRHKTNGNARAVVEEETQVMRASSYPRVGGPAIIYEDGMIRLIGQGVVFNYTDTIIDSPTGEYTIEGYNYHIEYSFDLETWTIYDGPFELLPSDYGKTLYAKLVGPNNGYISSEILYNEGVQKLVTAYQEHPSISDALLTYGQIQDLVAAKYEFNYVAMQFPSETERYQYMVSSKNVLEIALTKNIYRADENFTHMVATMQSPSNENAYVFSDMVGNKANYNKQTDELSYYNKDEKLTYLMSNGVLNQIIDANGNTLTIIRNGDTVTITDFNGRIYTVNGNIVYMPSGTIVYGYTYQTGDGSLHMINVGDPVKPSYTSFLGMSVVSRLAYESGLYVDYEYRIEDDYYTIVTETTSKGTNAYYYDLKFNLVMEVDYYGNKTYYEYDSDTNDLISRRCNGKITQYDYDDNGNVIKTLEGNYSEDDSNAGYEITEPLSTTSEFTYNLQNRLISEKYPEENEIRYHYDTHGNLTRVQEVKEEGLQDIQILTYDNRGNVLTDTGVESSTMKAYTYDSLNNIISVTTTDLNDTSDTSTITYTYDSEGRVLSETSSDYTNTYVFNQTGNILLQYVNGEYTRNVYNEIGQLKIIISNDEYLASEDGLYQPIKRDTYTNVEKGIRYSYAVDGQIKTELKRNTMASVNVYDKYGNLQKKSIYNKKNYNSTTDNYMYQIVYQPNGLVERYRVNGNTKLLNTYDDNDNLVKVAYANSQNIQYTYSNEDNPSNVENNINNLLIGVKFKNDSLDRFTYSYDEDGDFTEIVDVINNTKTIFDEKGYEIIDQNTNNNIQSYETENDKTIEKVLNNTYTTEENNGTVVLKKNNTSVIDSVKDYGSDGKLNSLQTTLYQGNHNITLIETPTYDKELITNYAVCGINNTTYNFQYMYDEHKNIKKEYGSFNNSFYTYDEHNQLIRVIDSVNNRTTVFEYDDRGNLIKEITYSKNDYAHNGNNATPLDEFDYVYGNTEWQDQLTKVNNRVITYDEAGNRTSYNGWTYTWEGGRQLASMSKGGTTITYKYDSSGSRVGKIVNDTFIKYTFLNGRITSQNDGTNQLYFYYDEYNSLLGFEYNGIPYLYIKNIQGDVYGITDVNGTLLVQYEYDAWGQVTSIIGNTTLGQINPMRYRGYYYDEETGLYYLYSRYYDASVRRFINVDVFEMIELSDSFISYNLYAYCENNSLKHIDIFGYKKINITNKLKKTMKENADYLYNKYSKWYYYFALCVPIREFIKLVKTNGKWDLKNKKEWTLKGKDYYVIDGYKNEKFTAEDIGNIHFGYVGSVFFTGLSLATGAGFYQILSGADWRHWYSFFDQPRDTYCISIGRTMWAQYYNKYVTQI